MRDRGSGTPRVGADGKASRLPVRRASGMADRMTRTHDPRIFALVAALGALGVLWRVLPHEVNVAPVAALAMFGAWAARRAWVGAGLALGVLIASDLILGRLQSGFAYDPALQAVVWGALALPALFARALPARARRALAWCALPAVAASASFFLLTNGAVWALGGAYPRTPSGLAAAYAAGIPFIRGTLTGDLAFTLALFGGAALAEARGLLPTRKALPA